MGKRLIISFLVVLLILASGYFWWKDATSAIDPKSTSYLNFEINKGQSVREIVNNLKIQNLIKDKIAMFIYLRISGIDQQIQAGNFRFSKSMSMMQIAQELTLGKNDIQITLIEGWRVEESAQELSKKLSIPEQEFLRYAKEGYMFPDTYLIPQDATPKEIADSILANFQNKIGNELINQIKAKNLTLDQVVTLASLIERETKKDEDRAIVAGILMKRVKEGWPLQIDASVQFALGYQAQEKTWWKKELTYEDLEIDSPYNTYKNLGIPPGPIASPGLSSIKAIINPKNSEYWFYISDKSGNMHYAKDQEEQDQNIARYLQR